MLTKDDVIIECGRLIRAVSSTFTPGAQPGDNGTIWEATPRWAVARAW